MEVEGKSLIYPQLPCTELAEKKINGGRTKKLFFLGFACPMSDSAVIWEMLLNSFQLCSLVSVFLSVCLSVCMSICLTLLDSQTTAPIGVKI